MAPITINGNSLDPTAERPALRAFGLEAPDASKSDYILVQTKGPLETDQKGFFTRLGIEIQEYVSENTYLCGYKGTDLSTIRSLPYVSWADIYLQLFVVPPELKSAPTDSASQLLPSLLSASRSRTPHLVDIIVHDDVDPSSDTVKSAVATAARADVEDLTIGRGKVRLTVQEQYMEELAAIDAVRLIQEVRPVKLHNNKAREIIKAQVVVNDTVYRGADQVVAVADTGFDKGSTTDTHHAFEGRVKKLYSLGRDRADDPDGHGTHVCGSVLGDGTSASMGGRIQGVAPEATLVVQSLLDTNNGLGGIPSDLADLFLQPYENDKARVHTNSWGSGVPNVQLPYDESSREIDRFVWNHPDLVICFAAGNDGIDRNRNGVIDMAQIGAQAAAKNCISVGASENLRPDIKKTYGIFLSQFPVAPIRNDPMASDSHGLAAFSSRGPTKERRYKPDIVAPGTAILSTRSRICPPTDLFGESSDPAWMYLAGTSMATPLVAGCVAVLRETLVKNGTPEPSAALIKALLLNGATSMLGQYSPNEIGPSPNFNSGFGRVDLSNSVITPGGELAGFGEGGPLDQGKTETFTVNIPSKTPGLQTQGIGSQPIDSSATGSGETQFKITLVWTDPEGPLLQNDLDLIVRAADGRERHGNMGTQKGFDRVNNVEQVTWTNVPPGPLTVVIRAFRITRFSQPFAYAWRISSTADDD